MKKMVGCGGNIFEGRLYWSQGIVASLGLTGAGRT